MPDATLSIFDGVAKPFRLESMPLPQELRAKELLIKIELATICGSDLHTLSGRRTATTPCVLGHEAVGRVVARGDGTSFKVGTRVTWSITDSCGTCPLCASFNLPEKCETVFKYGHAPLSDGSGLNGCYASHILLRSGTRVVRVPDCLSNSVATPANCALATMVNAVSRVPANAAAVVIQGAGLLGLYGCALLRERGVKRVYCTDIVDDRLAHVSRFGGTPIGGGPDVTNAFRAQMRALPGGGADAVIEVTGAADVVPTGIELLRPGGAYVFVGMVHPDTRLDITGEQIVRKCLTVAGVHNYRGEHLEEAIRFLELTHAKYPYESLVSSPIPLARLDEAVALAKTRKWPRVAVEAS